jgi:uncharacterized protein (DUF433 family)
VISTPPHSKLASGAYTLPDAARLLRLPLAKLRAWVLGRGVADALGHRGTGKDRTFDFYTLIELFTIAQLRAHGLSWPTLRKARAELMERFQTPHPFALEGLLVDSHRLLKELGDETLLELGSGGQTAFEKVIAPFCCRLDFDRTTKLATRFYPEGSQAGVVIDPQHAFGRPIIRGTNITTEALACLIRGGEKIEDVAQDFRLEREQVENAWEFERRLAA